MKSSTLFRYLIFLCLLTAFAATASAHKLRIDLGYSLTVLVAN